jgi:hypothetical protein
VHGKNHSTHSTYIQYVRWSCTQYTALHLPANPVTQPFLPSTSHRLLEARGHGVMLWLAVSGDLSFFYFPNGGGVVR